MSDKRARPHTRREKRNADELRQRREQPCARCGMAIDYSAPPGDPNSFNAGHKNSWAHHPLLREDPENLQPEHERCNKSAHDDDSLSLGVNSRRW